jgi:hypothetical protein
MNKQYLTFVLVIVLLILAMSPLACNNVSKIGDSSYESYPVLVSPCKGTMVFCSIPVDFKWLPYKECTGYQFILSMDQSLRYPLLITAVLGTEYEYTGPLKCYQNYFWRVRASEPYLSEYSPISTFWTAKDEAPVIESGHDPYTFLFDRWAYILIAAILLLILGIFIWLFVRSRNQ